MKNIDVLDPISEIGRREEKIRREEAKVAGQQELHESGLDSQFESLENDGKQAEIETRVASLTAGGATKAVTSGT